MEWNGLFGLLYGLFGGFFEFLPVSPLLHQQAFLKIAGLDIPGYGLDFAVHFGALVAVIVSYYGKIGKLTRERKIAAQPKRKRKRQPDISSLMESRLLRVAAVPVTLICLLTPWASGSFNRLWLIALIAVVNGVIVLLPQHMVRANKDSRTLSPLDATLIGLAGMLAAIPGISRMGVLTSVASMRGADRRFGLDFAYLLMIPALAALCIGDLAMLLFSGASFNGVSFLTGIIACVAAFAAGFAGIRLMRFLAFKESVEGLACYNWGLAMFTFIIYLIG